jgi:ribose 5-phosphate isomerase A
MTPPKLLVARQALSMVSDGMTVGLGSGSTATLFIQELILALRAGRLNNIVGVPTSCESERLAREGNIPVDDFSTHPTCDITIDGADEVTPSLDLIKGLGGALLREKIVAQNSRRLVIIVDESKCVSRLGTRSPLPVEVTQFGLGASDRFLRSIGATPVLRTNKDSTPFVTDNHHFILDCRFESGIADPVALVDRLAGRAGIVEHGLFVGIARTALIAGTDGQVRQIDRTGREPATDSAYTTDDGCFRRPH